MRVTSDPSGSLRMPGGNSALVGAPSSTSLELVCGFAYRTRGWDSTGDSVRPFLLSTCVQSHFHKCLNPRNTTLFPLGTLRSISFDTGRTDVTGGDECHQLKLRRPPSNKIQVETGDRANLKSPLRMLEMETECGCQRCEKKWLDFCKKYS